MGALRLITIFRGRVQGVGFRWTTLGLLRDAQVTGYVRNLPDGSVELLLEGDELRISEALDRVRRVLAGHITQETSSFEGASGEFPDFRVRP